METLILPIAMPQSRLASAEYLSEVELTEFDPEQELYFAPETREIVQHIGDYCIVVKFD